MTQLCRQIQTRRAAFTPRGQSLPACALAWLICAACLSLPATAQNAPQISTRTTSARTPAAALYRIAGTVINTSTGEPVRHALVAALSEEDNHTVASVTSDNDGHFALQGLAAAKYQLTASKRGFRTAFYDEHDEFNSAIVTGPDQDTGNLAFRLVPGGMIRGTILTDGGDPVENAHVLLFLQSHEGKTGPPVSHSDSTNTDDTGTYEFNNLAPGDYLLAVLAEPWYALHHSPTRGPSSATTESDTSNDPGTALDVAYPVTYFDSTTDESSATHIQLTGGSRVQADMTLHAVPALRIQVDTPRKPDGSIARAELKQTVFGTVVGSVSAGFLDAMQSGTTEFSGVAPGHYELAQGDPPRVVEMDATSNQQVDASQGAATQAVHGTLETASGKPLSDDCNVSLDPIDSSKHPNPIESVCLRGAFTFPTVPAGEWQLSADSGGRQLPIASMTVEKHTVHGNLLTVQDRPLSIVVAVTQGATRVEGFARRGGKGVSGVMVVLVPRDLEALDSLSRRDQSDSDGSFALRDVAPGQYTLVAIEDGWPLAWDQPRVIGRYLRGGIPVTVSDKSGAVLTLPVPVKVQPR